MMTKKVSVLAVLAIFFTQFSDFATTTIGLHMGAAEKNGFMDKVISNYGISGFLIVKVLAAVVLAYLFARRPLAAWSVSLMFLVVSLWNLTVIYRLSTMI